MFKQISRFVVAISVFSLLCRIVWAEQVLTIDQYNDSLVERGVVWNDQTPSFYTGFAMRVENPDYIHTVPCLGYQFNAQTALREIKV